MFLIRNVFLSIIPALIVFQTLVAPSITVAQSEFDFQMSSPVNCDELDLCYVQNYMDQNDGPQWQDYSCRHLSYDAHNGTDVRVSYDDMLRGVPVMAVADGVVLGLRDGMEDVSIRSRSKHALHGKFAGNAVYIDHNGGIETQYSHLKKNSITVKKGDFVERGQTIGMVGLSGNTEFSHVELGLFVSGKYVDPFVGEHVRGCGKTGVPLWDDEALRMLSYKPRGVIDAAFVNGKPDLRRVLLRSKRPFHPDSGNRMTFWAAMYGIHKDDILHISVTGPKGKVVAQRNEKMTRNLAQKVAYVNVQTKKVWPSGTYVGRCELTPTESGAEPVVVIRELHVPDSR